MSSVKSRCVKRLFTRPEQTAGASASADDGCQQQPSGQPRPLKISLWLRWAASPSIIADRTPWLLAIDSEWGHQLSACIAIASHLSISAYERASSPRKPCNLDRQNGAEQCDAVQGIDNPCWRAGFTL